ncbi:hypothetical protein HUK80_01980 [Flavobacterium sp. MAH-1]|uniref:Lipocalin-like domain-containing protein n=1 Tax=Flavobacterium agri TaxID=2743471 RepID=A0A7Y8XZ98_9FLAO|nr:hypothetical protein [Flavobacterium agri]NUY79649.1 hypothetical protein [Flavobacterium agri]NYA69674.1 hypothetical protein [Flavobacterium agri]
MKFKLYTSFLVLSLGLIIKVLQTENDIVGTWNYVETRNSSGQKIKSYTTGFGEVEASGPKIIYNSNASYKMIFSPKNIDSGNWRFDKSEMKIIHQLYIDSTDWIGKDLIKNGEAKKYKDGKYYEMIETKVSKLTKNEMVIVSRDVLEVYKKSN